MKKEFCSYWIRHGECDYQQQGEYPSHPSHPNNRHDDANPSSAGCLYKHEMPTDPALLEKLGLRDIPRWYREKYGVPSLLPHGHRSQANNHQAQHWREDAGPKAIQYPSRVGFNGGDFHALESDKPGAQASKHRAAANYHGGGALIPDQPRAYTAINNAPKGPMAHRNAPKTLHAQPKAHMPAAGRFDLLTSDLSDQYDQLAVSGMGVSDSLGYPMGRSSAEQAFYDAQVQAQAATDRSQREDIMRNLHALVPASMPASGGILDRERPQTPFDATPCPVRSKRSTQQPRRLPYQQHQRSGDDSTWSFKDLRDAVPPTMQQSRSTGGAHIPTGSKTGSPTIRAGGVGSGSGNGHGHGHGHGNRGVGVVSGIGGSTMSSDPPTGPATPEEHSHSSHSSRSGSHALYRGGGGKENEQPKPQQHARQHHHVQHGHGHGHGQHARDAYHSHSQAQAQYPYQQYAALAHAHPHGAIGSKRMQHQKSGHGGVDDDLFGLGMGMGGGRK
jgi:hypothetical protein